MKKFFILILSIVCCFIYLSGCKSAPDYTEHVCELKSNIFEGESASYRIRAHYGYKKTPSNTEGDIESKIYKLSFRLVDNYNNDITYTLSFKHLEKEYTTTFLINPVKHSLTAEFEIENFTENSFTVSIKVGSDSEDVTLRSIVPENALSSSEALLSVKQNQSALWDLYLDENGNFTAKIVERIIVKDGKPYWYVGFIKDNNNLKALLVDGFNGEILAIKDVI